MHILFPNKHNLGYIDLMSNRYEQSKTVNSAMLKTMIENAGGLTVVAYEADVGHSTLEKMMNGSYPALPRKKLRDKICKYLKAKEAELFPFVANDRKKSA